MFAGKNLPQYLEDLLGKLFTPDKLADQLLQGCDLADGRTRHQQHQVSHDVQAPRSAYGRKRINTRVLSSKFNAMWQMSAELFNFLEQLDKLRGLKQKFKVLSDRSPSSFL